MAGRVGSVSLASASVPATMEKQMSVRAKFFVKTTSAYAVGNGSVELAPATRGAENAQWAAATPSGSVTLTINNPPAFQWFVDRLGSEVYIDFTSAPDFSDAKTHDFVLFEKEGHYGNGRCLHCGQDEAAHS